MKNPWLSLNLPHKYNPKGRYVLQDDAKHITAYNKYVKQNQKFIIRDHLLPAPFAGRLNAPILILLLNPGYSPKTDVAFYKNQKGYEFSRQRLSISNKTTFFYLDDAFASKQGGPAWWRKVFRSLIVEGNINLEVIKNNFWALEFFPYHSKSFKQFPFTLPSQSYNFHLLRNFLTGNRKDRIVLISRGEEQWFTAVPELNEFSNHFISKNPRRTLVTENMFGTDAYKIILKILKSKKKV